MVKFSLFVLVVRSLFIRFIESFVVGVLYIK